jgi:hypothetical protein
LVPGAQRPVLNARCSTPGAQRPVLGAERSLLGAWCSTLGAGCSTLGAECLDLKIDTRYPGLMWVIGAGNCRLAW